MTTIFAQIRKEQNDFMYNYVSVVTGYPYNQYETIKRIALYLNSKYEDGTTFMGREKLFFNIVLPPCEVAMRMLNFDTKNIKLWPMNPKSQFSTWLLEKELKLWLKTSKMGRILNQIAEEAPRYGSVVLEKTKDGAEVVDLRRLMLDPTVDSIQKSRFVTTVHYMTPTELRATGWNNVEIAIERFGNTLAQDTYEDTQGNLNLIQSSPYIKVHRRFGEVPERWLGGNSDKMVKAVFIVAGAEDQLENKEGQFIGEAGVVLFQSKWNKEYPFKDFHYMKQKGRWLGVGIVEMLFDVQVRVNELKNQKRVSMELSTMHLFQTKDKSIVRNVLTDLSNGDLIISPNGIEPIANEERNLPAFNDEENAYLQQVDKLSFAYEAIRGEQETQTTLGQTQIAVATGTSVYAFKKENLGIFLQEFFNELVLPQLMKDLTPEHIMRFVGSAQELAKLDELASEVYANDIAKEKILSGNLFLAEDLEMLKEKAKAQYRKQGEARFLKIKESFYNDAEFEFDFLIGNEQADPIKLATNIQTVLQPLLETYGLEDPRVQLLYGKFSEFLGINPAEMEIANQMAQRMPQGQTRLDAPQDNQPRSVQEQTLNQIQQ